MLVSNSLRFSVNLLLSLSLTGIEGNEGLNVGFGLESGLRKGSLLFEDSGVENKTVDVVVEGFLNSLSKQDARLDNLKWHIDLTLMRPQVTD